jgi:hypothetical protein
METPGATGPTNLHLEVISVLIRLTAPPGKTESSRLGDVAEVACPRIRVRRTSAVHGSAAGVDDVWMGAVRWSAS